VSASHEQPQDDGLGGILRRVLSPGQAPEERLEELLAERRRELDETAARFDASIADLERREELLRDSRASVERLLRLGRTDLEARETELTEFLQDLTERETRVARAEAEISRRRQELGAVELKRATIERRERDVAAREDQVAALETELAQRPAPATAAEAHAETVELAFVPGASYRLVELTLADATAGSVVEVDAETYAIGRIGPSPLPGDPRRCAFLVSEEQVQP
jgi:hypothetical protein